MKILLYSVYQNQTMFKDTQFNLRVEYEETGEKIIFVR